MAGLTWIFFFLCAAGCPRSAARAVRPGQNVTLPCGLSSRVEVTWYLLRSDRLLPLLTATPLKLDGHEATFHSNDTRIGNVGAAETGPVDLEISGVQETDAGRYFCIGRCAGCINGVLLNVTGVDRESAGHKTRQPCWTLGTCVLPAAAVLALTLILVLVFALCRSSGGSTSCCCTSSSGGAGLSPPQEASLHYSSLKHLDKPRPPAHSGGTGLVEEGVTYSTVAFGRSRDRS